MDFVLGHSTFLRSSAVSLLGHNSGTQEREEPRSKQALRLAPTKACAEHGRDSFPDINLNTSQTGSEFPNVGPDSLISCQSSTIPPLPPSRSLFSSPLISFWFANGKDDCKNRSTLSEIQKDDCETDQTKRSDEDNQQLDPSHYSFPASMQTEAAAGDAPRKKGWIENLLHFNSFRKESTSHSPAEKCSQPYVCNDCAQRTLEELADLQNVIIVGENIIDEPEQNSSVFSLPRGSETIEGPGCCLDKGCLGDTGAYPSSFEQPYPRNIQDRETFSPFLHAVPLGQLKLITKMSYLCNLAYKIRGIKPHELYQTCRVTYVTSSLNRKAESLLKDKVSECKKANEKKIGNDPSQTAISKLPSVDNADCQEGRENEGVLSATAIPSMASELAAEAARYIHLLGNSPVIAQDLEKEGSTVLTSDRMVEDINYENDGSGSLNDEVYNYTHVNRAELGSVLITTLPEHGKVPSCGADDMEQTFSDSESHTSMVSIPSDAEMPEDSKQADAKDLQSLHFCPCEWFCCDDKENHVRYFVIQGSESLASWQTNLLFEPILFEDSALGVLVHRGIYEAAKGLYEQMVPEIEEYLMAQGNRGRIQLTGHSLGGSLATLVFLMLQVRGHTAASSFLPVVTFGSPCVMCGGDKLLEQLGLPDGHIQCVVMHRDIVPRTFACEYPQHVVEVLKRIYGTFREHPCLMRQKLLYAPMGQYLILQPDQQQAPSHPFLPTGRGFYLLGEPDDCESILVDSKAVESKVALRAAQRAFLNAPHPLQILSDPGAYGPEGSISRDHDARSYNKTLGEILRRELKRARRARREHRQRYWWPLVAAELPPFESIDHLAFSKQPFERIDHLTFPKTGFTSDPQFKDPHSRVSGDARGNMETTIRNFNSTWGTGGIIKHHSPHHLQILVLGLFWARMLLAQGFATFFAWA